MGKTAVFVLATLQQMEIIDNHVSVLVMCHTRELAFQISKEYERFSKYMPTVKVNFIFLKINIVKLNFMAGIVVKADFFFYAYSILSFIKQSIYSIVFGKLLRGGCMVFKFGLFLNLLNFTAQFFYFFPNYGRLNLNVKSKMYWFFIVCCLLT